MVLPVVSATAFLSFASAPKAPCENILKANCSGTVGTTINTGSEKYYNQNDYAHVNYCSVGTTLASNGNLPTASNLLNILSIPLSVLKSSLIDILYLFWASIFVKKSLPIGCYTGATGDYIAWRQGDSTWKNVPLGSGGATIGSAGCLAT